MDISNLVKTMNRIEDHDASGMFECLAFVDNTIAAFELSEADNSSSTYVKGVFSESADRAIETALMTEYDQIQIMFESADYFNEKSDNFIVRAWEKFKGWMTSFWNWITRKKEKSSSDKATKTAKGTSEEHEVKLAIAYRKKTSLDLKLLINKLKAKIEKINSNFNMPLDKKKKANAALVSAIKTALNVIAVKAEESEKAAKEGEKAESEEERSAASKKNGNTIKDEGKANEAQAKQLELFDTSELSAA